MAKKDKDPVRDLEGYRKAIPAEVRADILDALLDSQKESFQDFTDMMTFVMAHILVGNIPADVAETLKGYFELLFTAVSANTLAKGGGGDGKVTAADVAKARTAAKARLEPRVQLTQGPDGLSVDLDVVPAAGTPAAEEAK